MRTGYVILAEVDDNYLMGLEVWIVKDLWDTLLENNLNVWIKFY